MSTEKKEEPKVTDRRRIHVEDHQELFDATIAELKLASQRLIPAVVKRVRRRIGQANLSKEQLAIIEAVVKGFKPRGKGKDEIEGGQPNG